MPKRIKPAPITGASSPNRFLASSRRAASAREFASRGVSWKRRGWLSRFALVHRTIGKVSQVHYTDLPKRRVLVLAPHPEEPVEKCFATIHGFLKSGSDVKVHVLTTGAHGVELSPQTAKNIAERTRNPDRMAMLSKIETRLKELREADKLLGVKSRVHSMDFYDSNQVSRRDVEEMRKVVGDGKWDVVIMPDRLDLQPTHAVVYDLAKRFLRRAVRRNRKPIELWGFETTYHRHPLSELSQVVSYTPEVQDVKMKAVQAHVSQDSRRGVYILGRMAEAEHSSAIAESSKGFGSHVDFKNAQRIEAFSVNVLKPAGPFVVSSKRK